MGGGSGSGTTGSTSGGFGPNSPATADSTVTASAGTSSGSSDSSPATATTSVTTAAASSSGSGDDTSSGGTSSGTVSADGEGGVQAQDETAPQGSDLVPWHEGAKQFGASLLTGGGNILAGIGKTVWDVPTAPVDVFFGTKYSYASQSIDQAIAAGATPSDMYKEMGRNAITFGGRSLDQAWEEWDKTGDPSQFQQASGSFFIGALGGRE